MKISFKRILLNSFLLFVSIVSNAQTQVVNLSTGIRYTGALIPVEHNDDTWTVLSPGGSTYDSAKVVNAVYPGQDNTVRFISPESNGFGGLPNGSDSGDYFYKQTFNFPMCNSATSASITFSSIGADNLLSYIYINGHPHAVNAAFNPILFNVTITIPPSEIIPGLNIITVKVYNNGYSPTGFVAKGDLTVNYSATPTPLVPSFTSNPSYCQGSPIVLDGSASTGPVQYYVWTVVESNSTGTPVSGATEWWSPWGTGMPGSYTLPAAVNGGPTLQCGKYYKVKLALQNPCIAWSETSRVIYIACPPAVTLTTSNRTICEESSATLTATASGSSPFIYNWYQTSPSAATLVLNGSSTLNVSPTVTSTYSVSVTSSAGCTTGKTVTVNVLPSGYFKNLSTGYDNSINAPAMTGFADDEWYAVSAPYNSNINALATCINHTIGGGLWAYDPGTAGRWITADAYGSDAKNQLYAGTGHYIYENHFTVPVNYICTLTLNKFAADNDGSVMLDGTTLMSLNPSAPSTNYTVGTTSPVTVSISSGSHVLKADIIQYDRYTGMFLNAYLSGSCSTGEMGQTPKMYLENTIETAIENNFSIYPNPGDGLFTLRLENEAKARVEIYDVLGKKIMALEQNTLISTIDLTRFPKGMYMVNVISNGTKTSKKIVLE